MNHQNKIFCSNPQAQFSSYREEILEAILKVCEKGTYILGEEVEGFESEFATYHNTKFCIGVGSGTDALTLTLKAFDIGAGDEVITVSHTALATSAAVLLAGATPVLIDIEENYYTLDPYKIEAAITSRTKAIIPVHLYGQPCDMDPILEIAKKNNLLVIEDCSQAHGATFKGRKVGTLGDAGCFSFYPTKNLGALGDAGGIITDNEHLQMRIKQIRQYGWNSKRISQEPGCVSRLDELQAAVLRVKLKHLDSNNAKRNSIAQEYEMKLNKSHLILPKIRLECEHAFHLYVVRSQKRELLKYDLAEIGIETGIHYAYPVHRHPGYCDKIRISQEGLERTEKIVQEILTLPIYPEFESDNIFKMNEVLHF
ncbi:DegT/DnrJ/EryC1/StrS family aminotransferase [Fluviispira multicolorata]|uniref:Erythromycin biosynthesis sensory transduction protein eryC1 n=1 Tax=Fluviispira multicolorata TaxID=2654512 RepID=A0A833N2C4_9BACT|nr:DegT/DnrJ/EryC1/StrS family aminotransferase [Fluviispira multicolorata]KAB8028012.1 erythromycin biosynthesis sensory transduction protein eryC1 [Fluviispira multicolorata]